MRRAGSIRPDLAVISGFAVRTLPALRQAAGFPAAMAPLAEIAKVMDDAVST